LLALYDLVLHHADQKLFDRSAAETVNDLANGAGGDIVRLFGSLVDVCSAIRVMGHVALFLKAPKNGADRRVLQWALRRQGFAHLLGRGGAVRPKEVHDQVLQLTQCFSD